MDGTGMPDFYFDGPTFEIDPGSAASAVFMDGSHYPRILPGFGIRVGGLDFSYASRITGKQGGCVI
jgi:hypothetical protein